MTLLEAVDNLKNKAAQAIAIALPRRLAYWVAIRVLSGATFDRYEDWLENMIIAKRALDAWRDSGNDDNWETFKGRFKW